ncbi:MAG: InlB B-repeat-containing protein, partial [Paludibacteraceae bacterium]|nr:InlB B-repeat-containing protein [Paludibacteraceae bacterium]
AGTKEHGVNYTLSSNKFTRTGYTQTGWSTSDGGAKVYDLGGTYTANTDVTLYPFWELATYNITYDNLKGATHTNPATYTINSATITFTAPTSKPAGYTFANWSPASIATGSTGNKTVTANWTAATSTVELNQEEATEKGTASVTATYGSAMPAITKLPIRTGYTFGGYYTGKNGAGTQYYKADGTSATTWNLEGAQTLYAKWTPITYSVKFNGNGSTSGSMSNQSFTYDEAAKALTTNAFKQTGYTFAGWNTAANGSGTSYADGARVQNLTTTNNATINLYAQWTVDKYTLTFGAGEGGEVTAKVGGNPISSPAALDYNTQVVLTATPTGENAFAQWVNEEGVKVSTDNPYTFKLTTNTTIKAEFSKPTTVYLKPSNEWKESNAHFAIYAWGGKSGDPWVDMEAVNCEGDYYKANVPAGFSDFAFVRLKEGGEHDWANKLNQTGNLTVQTNGKNMYDVEDKTMTYIHLEAKAWDNGDERFAAYFFGNGDKWVNLTKNGDVYSCKKPEGYTSVIFCRMNKNNADNNFNNCWNKTKDLSLMDNGDNCFWINTDSHWGCAGTADGNVDSDSDGKIDGADGGWYRLLDDSQWKAYSTPTYNVTIKPTIHGTYSVVCNGRAYPVTYKKDVVIPDVPMGTILTIQDVKPNKEAEYTSDIVYKESANAAYQKLEGNQITVCGNTTIDENFVTENTHVVYLRIPNGLAWNTDDHQYLYAYDKLEGVTVPLTAAPNASNYEAGYTYYTCTIPAGTHTIRFEYHKSGNTLYQTHDFPHVMPLGSLNCYTIQAIESAKVFNGYWSELLSNGDYRLLYVEQVVEKDKNNKTVITRKKAHPSNIIKKRTETGTDIVSLHVYNQNRYNATYKWENGSTPLTYDSPSNSAVILQQYDGSKWVDIQHHMVFGPLEAHVYTAMLPGRRNATAEDEPLVAQLKADYGIENIKNDDHPDQGNGVWNFPIKQTVDGGNTVELMRKNVHRYEGEYYIRTDVANGGWFNYNPTNHMTRSDEAKANSNFSHYYCKWVESNNNVNVKFTVANDYGYAISDTLEADRTDLWGVALAADDDAKMVDSSQKLPTDANVRFAWNEYSNFVHRAYIAGSAVVSDRFLVLEGDANIFDAKGNSLAAGVDNGTDPRFGLNANEEIFRDNSNWIYYADVQMKPMAPVKVTAKYDGHTQYFIGKQDQTVSLLQGKGEEKYLIRMLYDFKTNQLISAYVPGASDKVNAISTNLMLIRQNNNEATQLIFNNAAPHDMETIPADRRAYGVIEFTEKRLINGKDDEDKSLNEYEKSLYWISFPFNVDVSKAICFGEYGKHWIIQEYNGARRAAEGMWLDSETFWDYKWDQNIILEAGKGYVLALDVDQIASDGLFGLAGNRPIGIYFPSTEYISTAITEQTQVSTTVPAHVCTINRNTPKGDRRIADSHWNVIGVPSYVNAKGDYQLADIETQPKEVKYYYRWDGDFNAYTAMEKEGTKDFLSTHAYMVQFAGQINWQNIFNVNGVPKELAAKQSTDAEKEHRLRLELHQKGNKADHTFVRLQDEDGVTIRFDFNHDLCKVINAGANIYSVITAEESPVEVAANVMPIAETIIPVGVKITAAGEYTFRMPEGTDGIVVELIDYENNTRTNMLLDEYTVSFEKGTFDNRFALHVKPSKVATSVDNIGDEATGDKAGLRKFIIDGILYMQKDGVLYDAQGKLVR